MLHEVDTGHGVPCPYRDAISLAEGYQGDTGADQRYARPALWADLFA